jgi:hypothetical protein
MRLLRRLGLLSERRAGARTPVHVDARLEVGDLDLVGTACDLGDGGVFFTTPAPLEPGDRATLICKGDPVTVRVSWRREARGDRAAGLGLAFDPGWILIRR